MPYADTDDVRLYYRDLTAELEEDAETLLEQAEAAIRQELVDRGEDLDARVAAGTTQRVLLEQVESEMVAAVLKNPNSYASESQSVGGIAQSYTLDLKAASGLLRLTDDHRCLLGLGKTSRAGRAFTVGMSSSPPSAALLQPPRTWSPRRGW